MYYCRYGSQQEYLGEEHDPAPEESFAANLLDVMVMDKPKFKSAFANTNSGISAMDMFIGAAQLSQS